MAEVDVKTVILANGDYPVHPIPLQVLQQAERVVCCDGAANEYIRRGGVPWLIVGDGDSLDEAYHPLLQHIAEQSSNDLSKAVCTLLDRGVRRMDIVGATGKREDHTLGNISLLVEYMRQGAEVRLYTDYGVFIPCRDDVTLSSVAGQQVSIFNFGAKGLRGENLKYPLSDFTAWWQGTLNEALGPSFTIHASGDYLVFLNYFSPR